MSSRVGMISAAFIASLATLNRHRGQHLFQRMRIVILAVAVAVALVMGPTSMASIAILLSAASSIAIICRAPTHWSLRHGNPGLMGHPEISRTHWQFFLGLRRSFQA